MKNDNAQESYDYVCKDNFSLKFCTFFFLTVTVKFNLIKEL